MYTGIEDQAKAYFKGERDKIANAANLSAILFENLPEINWAGFYFLQGDELVLGPFQGRAACVRIALGKGVCGTAALERRSLVVPDVAAFPGHIACDAASRSEAVVPIVKKDRLMGVLDLDSPKKDRFHREDREGLERLVELFIASTDL
jgi:GAF domain-containing protein